VSYLFAAYFIIWVFLFGYVLYLTRKTNRLQKEIESLKAWLSEEGQAKASPTSPQSQEHFR